MTLTPDQQDLAAEAERIGSTPAGDNRTSGRVDRTLVRAPRIYEGTSEIWRGIIAPEIRAGRLAR